MEKFSNFLFFIFLIFFFFSSKKSRETSRQRRQSAPPTPLMRSFSSPDQETHDACRKAIFVFNLQRRSQRFDFKPLNETTNASVITQNDDAIDDFQMTDVSIDENERKRLIEMNRALKKSRTLELDEKNAAIYSNCPTEKNRSKRLSLPTMQSNRKGNFIRRNNFNLRK